MIYIVYLCIVNCIFLLIMYFILDRINVLSLRMIAGNYVVKLYIRINYKASWKHSTTMQYRGVQYYIDSGWLGDQYWAEANKRQYWLTDHPLFVIFYIKITLIMGTGPKSPIKRDGRCNLTFPTFRMINLLPVSF